MPPLDAVPEGIYETDISKASLLGQKGLNTLCDKIPFGRDER